MTHPRWRLGRHYPIHVYEGDRPVATFHTAADARSAVLAVNAKAEETELANEQDRRPHSRACGFKAHPHGPDCAVDCPTCRPAKEPTP